MPGNVRVTEKNELEQEASIRYCHQYKTVTMRIHIAKIDLPAGDSMVETLRGFFLSSDSGNSTYAGGGEKDTNMMRFTRVWGQRVDSSW